MLCASLMNSENKQRKIQMNKIKNQLEYAGYDYAIAIATEAERKAQAACGQLATILEVQNENK